MKKGLLMFTLLATTLSGAAHADSAAIKQLLAKLGVQSSDVQPSPIKGISTVLTDSGVIYVTDDGKHIIQGPMYDVSGAQPVNVTNTLLAGKLNALEKEMIVYKAPQEKHVITVFTDITCGYCHKLHEQMSDYNALGITVRYLAFPRQGLQSEAEQNMKAIWCAKDRNKALDDAMSGKGVQPASCDVDIAKHYMLGVQLGVNGTPAMVLSDGTLMPGYRDPKDLKALLDEGHDFIGSDRFGGVGDGHDRAVDPERLGTVAQQLGPADHEGGGRAAFRPEVGPGAEDHLGADARRRIFRNSRARPVAERGEQKQRRRREYTQQRRQRELRRGRLPQRLASGEDNSVEQPTPPYQQLLNIQPWQDTGCPRVEDGGILAIRATPGTPLAEHRRHKMIRPVHTG